MKRSDMYITIIEAQEKLKAQGMDAKNISALERLTGISRPTIRNFIKNGCMTKVHGNTGKKRQHTKLSGYEEKLDSFISNGLVNSSRLLEELRRIGYTGGQTLIKEYVSQHRDLAPVIVSPVPIKRARRYTTNPGESFQMDWGFVNYDCGGITRRLACFVMVCNYCRKAYVEFFTAARQEFLFVGMIHAFKYLGGVPEKVITDNMKSVVTSRTGNEIRWNPRYQEFMSTVGFRTVLCKPRRSYTKGRVERLVKFVKGNFVPARSFSSLDDLNDQVLGWCRQRSSEMRAHTAVPDELHGTETFSKLPPDADLFYFLSQERTVSFDGFVAYEGRRFGVPFQIGTSNKVYVSREKSFLAIMNKDRDVLQTHEVDWNMYEHFCKNQFNEYEGPEEVPTNSILAPPMTQTFEPDGAVYDLTIYDRI